MDNRLENTTTGSIDFDYRVIIPYVFFISFGNTESFRGHFENGVFNNVALQFKHSLPHLVFCVYLCSASLHCFSFINVWVSQ